MLYLKYNLY